MKKSKKMIGKRVLACLLVFLLSFVGISWPENEAYAAVTTTKVTATYRDGRANTSTGNYEIEMDLTDSDGNAVVPGGSYYDLTENTVYIDGKPVTGATVSNAGVAGGITYKGSSSGYLRLYVPYTFFGGTSVDDVGTHTLIIPAGTVVANSSTAYILQNDMGFYLDGSSVTEKKVLELGNVTSYSAANSSDTASERRYNIFLNNPAGILTAGEEGTVYSFKATDTEGNTVTNNFTYLASATDSFRLLARYDRIKSDATSSSDLGDWTVELSSGTLIGSSVITNGYILKNTVTLAIKEETVTKLDNPTDITVKQVYSDLNTTSPSAAGIYFTTDVENDGLAYDTNWNMVYTPTGCGGNYTLKKLGANQYFLDIGGTATEGQIVSFKGYVDMLGYRVEYARASYQYVDGTWIEVSTSGELQLVGNQRANQSNEVATGIWATGDSALDEAYKNGTSGAENWDITLIGKTEAEGVFFNGSRVAGGHIKKYSDDNNYWYIGGFGTALNEGDTVTVKGDFVLQSDTSTYAVTILETKFKWTGTMWVKVFEEATLSLTGAEGENTTATQIYLKGDTVLEDYTIGGDNIWEGNYLYAITDGVYLNDTPVADATIFKYQDSKNYWFLKNFGTPATGDVLTIKGNFGPKGANVVNFAEVQFEWDGTQWGTPDNTVYKEFTISNIQTMTEKKDAASSWFAYFATSAELPGTAWDTVNGTIEEFPVEVSVDDGESFAVTAKKNDAQSLFLQIPYTKLSVDAEAKVTIKAGKYKSNAQEIGYNITEDYIFYTSAWGWSEDGVLTATTESPKFALDATNASNSVNGFVISTASDDGTHSNGWASDAYIYTLSTSKAYSKFTDSVLFWGIEAESGVYMNEEYVSDIHLVKLTGTQYYVALGNYGYNGESEGAEYFQIKGYFYDSNDKIVYYETGKYSWNGSAWEVVTESLEDKGVDADVNSDSVVTSQDLVRLIRHQADETVQINEEREDINYDGSKDVKDVSSLRKILLGEIYYRKTADEADQWGVPYGTPIVDKTKVIEKIGYSCPQVGTWEGTRYQSKFVPYSDEEIDALFQAYKEAGFTILLSEYVAMLTDQAVDSAYNDAIRTYLNGAARNGLGVIVQSVYLEAILRAEDLEGTYPNWQGVMDHYVDYLSDYPAFRGFMMSDELGMTYADNYVAIAGYLHEKYPNLILFSSELSNYATDLTEETTYKNYVDTFGLASGYFTYDNYSLSSKTTDYWIFGTTTDYYVEDFWYTNLKWVAERSIDSDGNQLFRPGVTIQSMSMPAGSGTNTEYARYAPAEDEDIGFQVYTSMAWGMESINYFSYCDHFDAEQITDEIQENTNVRSAVTNVNAEIDKFASVYQGFAWRQTLDLDETTNSSTGNERLTSVKTSGARTLVGCMKDEDGFDGYMIANADAPRAGTTASVTLTFKNATSAIAYVDGVEKTVALGSDGSCTFSIANGEGIFVIPIRGEM